MAAHVRHGAPGSFKSAAAIWIDLLKWLRQGREVFTNVRGLKDVADIELILGETFPDGAAVTVIDTDSQEMRHYFAAFFHWLPVGAALIIDEAQFVYPSRADFKPTSLDFPGGLNAATEAGRPCDIFTAIDKHRHYNWDICLTTPNIKKLPSWLRDTLESAYHHKNMEHIPVYGKRKARIHRHDPSSNGTSITKQSDYSLVKIPVKVHQLYGSTITGEITKNVAERNPFKNPRLLGFFGLATVALAFSSCQTARYFSDDSPQVSEPAQAPVTGSSTASGAPTGVSTVSDDVQGVVAPSYDMKPIDDALPSALHAVFIAGSLIADDRSVYVYRIYDADGQTRLVSPSWFLDAGFDLTFNSSCQHDLITPSGVSYRVLCEAMRTTTREPSGEEAASNSMPTFSSVSSFAGVDL